MLLRAGPAPVERYHHMRVPILRSFSGALAAAAILAAAPAIAQTAAKPLTPSQMVSPSILVKRIDLTCQSTKQFITGAKPTTVAYKSSTWSIARDADMTAAVRTKAVAMYADVWRQNGKYVWVHAHTFTQAGAQRASQLCFRPDGTLARVRQAGTMPAADAVGARAVYFNEDGSVIQKVGVVAMDDPLVTKKITSEPFYSTLP